MKFPTKIGVGLVNRDQQDSKNCYPTNLKNKGLAQG